MVFGIATATHGCPQSVFKPKMEVSIMDDGVSTAFGLQETDFPLMRPIYSLHMPTTATQAMQVLPVGRRCASARETRCSF
jgi:hypothetical protein